MEDLEVRRDTWDRWMCSSTIRWGEYMLVITPDQPPIAVNREGRWETLHLAEGDDLVPDEEWVSVAQHQAAGMFK